MGRLLVYLGNDPARVRCALHPGRALLVDDAQGVDGFGVGFYQGGEVLLQRRPKAPVKSTAAPAGGAPVPAIDLTDVARDLRTDAIVAHVRRGTHGAPKTENTHPFRFRSWLFAHHGTVAGFGEPMRAQLLESVPDYLQRNVRGETDSEVLFHVLLGRLHATGKMDDPTIAPSLVARALAETATIAEGIAGAGTSVLDLAATNGRVAVAARLGAPMYMYQVQGVRDCGPCREQPAELGRGPRPFDHDHLKAVVITAPGRNGGPTAAATASGGPGTPWVEVPDRSVVAVSHALTVEITPIDA